MGDLLMTIENRSDMVLIYHDTILSRNHGCGADESASTHSSRTCSNRPYWIILLSNISNKPIPSRSDLMMVRWEKITYKSKA